MSSPATSSPFTTHLLRQYEMPRRMLATLAEDFSEEDATRGVGNQKPLVWYLGHVAVTDNYFLTLYGGHESALSEEQLKRFGRGSDGHADFSDASKAEAIELLATLRERIRALISSLAPEDLDRETSDEARHPAFKTLGGALALIISHCGYHTGQVADLRREMGKDPMFG